MEMREVIGAWDMVTNRCRSIAVADHVFAIERTRLLIKRRIA
jgi:hypothetical protein